MFAQFAISNPFDKIQLTSSNKIKISDISLIEYSSNIGSAKANGDDIISSVGDEDDESDSSEEDDMDIGEDEELNVAKVHNTYCNEEGASK